MPTLVFDSPTLICLGKIRLLEKVAELRCRNIIPKLVYNEVMQKYPENAETGYIKKMVDEKLFEIREPNNRNHVSISPLSNADMQVLTLAKECGGIAIVDEVRARRQGELEDIETHGTIYLLFLLLEKDILDKGKTLTIIQKMIENGWYCSTDFYTEILKRLE